MSKFQFIVITFICVVEYMVISFVVKEAIWLRQLFVDLRTQDQSNNYVKILINIDSQSVKTFSENSVHHDRIKHVDIVYHYVRNEIKKNRIEFRYITIDIMSIDDFIKSLFSFKYQRFIDMLEMN